MPLINVKVIESQVTPEQKEQIIEHLTRRDGLHQEGENMRQVTW